MASYTTIQNGSRGPAVSEWQNFLISKGYNIGTSRADGVFGSGTLAATKKYQKDKGLVADGIVGKKTWGSMNTSTSTKKATPTAAQKQAEIEKIGDFKYDKYVVPDSVNAAYDKINNLQAPGEFQYGNQQMLEETFNKIMNGEKFSYDLNGDALYQQYKDQFTTQGKVAMQDTMGQAAAMTGGYGNSYAQSVGQQTYQGYLQQLNDKMPELYQLALEKHNMDRQELKDQYGMLLDDRNYAYGIHRDAVSDYKDERAYLTDEARWQSDDAWNKYTEGQTQKYNEHSAKYGMLADSRDYYYKAEQDKIANDLALEQLKKKITSDSGSGSSKGNVSGYNNGSVSSSNIKIMQNALGISADGKWGSNSSAAAGGMTADEAWKAYQNGTLGKNLDDEKNITTPNNTSGKKIGVAVPKNLTYQEACKVLKQSGIDGSGAMTASEWSSRKNGGSTAVEVNYYKSYSDYLADYMLCKLEEKYGEGNVTFVVS